MIVNIKMIAFDVFGVMVTEGHMVSNVLMPLLPSGSDKAAVRNIYNDYTRGEISEKDFWQGVGQPGNTQLRDTFLNSFAMDKDLSHTIQTLSTEYQLSILSNLGREWAKTLMQKFNFEQHFSPIIFSGDVNCQKPQSRIYEILIKKSQLKAGEIIFIDDRLENLKVANDLGMQTIHFKREDDTYNFQADYTINRLNELTKLLIP